MYCYTCYSIVSKGEYKIIKKQVFKTLVLNGEPVYYKDKSEYFIKERICLECLKKKEKKEIEETNIR